jgi:C-terminal processing protease CtpA/Prc
LISLASGCSPYIHNISDERQSADLSGIHEILENEYPFTDHKGLDWHIFTEDLISVLNNNEDPGAAYLDARCLVYDIPDSRINLYSPKDKTLRKTHTSGFIGFELGYTDQDIFFIASIDSQSIAWERGLRPGFEIIGWNQKQIFEAVKSFPLMWGFHPATDEFRKLLSCHYLCRGETGSTVEVFYINDQENSKGIRLELQEGEEAEFPSYVGIPNMMQKEKAVFEVLENDIGYYRINQFSPSILSHFRKHVIDELNRLSGLIIDLRQNLGGYDPVAVQIANHLISEVRLYEESFILEDGDYHIFGSHVAEPREPGFKKNIILLTGPLTMGVAEGFVRLVQEEDYVRTLGSWNTAGSFSLPGGQIKLGNGLKLNYPIGGALDEDHNIMLEAGEWFHGINPDIFIPPTKELILLMANGYDLLLEEAMGHIQRR